ncbi:hypothetical protein [Saccharothrix sp. ST-888]|uniref:hypothetical protein n=1 Tax=Saccharothrix sp. ST-888 TaxID=1427391 RepID=UPI0005ED3101|nr:hypothetical protein [Saccharothrix sp. ST-888]KJK59053.1 hypothetical protein UK12_06560 [Saccharothrix sp. ST-888]
MPACKPAARLAQALCLGIVCLGVSSSPAAAQTAVPCNAGALAAAITAANSTGDTLVLASGCTYALSTPLPHITGRVVIDGSRSTITRSSGPAFQVLVVDAGGNLNLRQAFITNGDGTGTFGGGIANSGILTVRESVISNSHADFAGGIGTNTGATTTLVNTQVVDNQATQNGGGLTNDGSLTLIRTQVTGNTAGLQGGGIGNTGTLRLQDSEINSNQANTAGGIVNFSGGATDLFQSHVNANTSVNAPGGISDAAGSVALVASDVSGNFPTNCAGSPLSIADCTG